MWEPTGVGNSSNTIRNYGDFNMSLISEAFLTDEISLKDKTALITGASSGIGLATAVWLAREGVHLILLARREEKLLQAKKEILERFPAIKVHIICADVNAKNIIDTLEVEGALDVDILINNAGLSLGRDHVVNTPDEDLQQMVDTNITAAFRIATAVAKKMLAANSSGASRTQGNIVNLGSTAAHFTYAGGAIYCATKFAVRAFSETLRQELHDKNIRVILVSPGIVQTEFSLVRFKGNTQKADAVYAKFDCLKASDIARTIVKALKEPTHVNWDEVLILPTTQAPVTGARVTL